VLGLVRSQNRVATTAAEKAKLHEQEGIAVDMESAALLSRARREGIPFYCIRVVSDRADETFPIDFNALRAPDGRIPRGKIILHGLLRPALWPKLWQLNQRARQSAKHLGEFLVRCRIQPESSPTESI
jgi:hypothetical protein